MRDSKHDLTWALAPRSQRSHSPLHCARRSQQLRARPTLDLITETHATCHPSFVSRKAASERERICRFIHTSTWSNNVAMHGPVSTLKAEITQMSMQRGVYWRAGTSTR